MRDASQYCQSLLASFSGMKHLRLLLSLLERMLVHCSNPPAFHQVSPKWASTPEYSWIEIYTVDESLCPDQEYNTMT